MTQAAARWSLQREGQYFKGTLLTPKPTASALAALQRPEPHQPLQATEVRFMILSSCLHSERLQLADWTWCSEVKCWAYLDTDCKASLAASIRAVRVVTPREYLMDHFLPSRNGSACCEPAVRQSNTSSSWDGLGPSSFFCTPHRQLTFSAQACRSACPSHMANDPLSAPPARPPPQYRFLPALAHGRAGSMAELKDGRLKWLVLVDDDSSVLLPRLLSVLAPYDDQARIQLGDFLVDDASSGAAQDQWLRPFACGGAGTVLSAGAARATDFAGCAMRYQHACLQSDWVSQGHLARSMCSLPTTRANGPGRRWGARPASHRELNFTAGLTPPRSLPADDRIVSGAERRCASHVSRLRWLRRLAAPALNQKVRRDACVPWRSLAVDGGHLERQLRLCAVSPPVGRAATARDASHLGAVHLRDGGNPADEYAGGEPDALALHHTG